ncbi:type II secretion system protein PulP [Geobacter sp. SVR]|uniref:type II secretion system protein PulP n=1 Tax=Geobacter sp. SVR TaxID=2495594 RepID=UPI00143EF63B|nr:type II secretion system protein PulP [Geobacter sp. SVR]BCS53667.1 type II secretion system protein PulP [Geobacter sp. SVR]GCF84136.1 type II secretion system protein PulP [Geobacter sp. SVR]
MNRQRLLLLILVILFVLSAIWSYLKWPRQRSVPQSTPGQAESSREKGRAATPAAPAAQKGGGTALRLDLLDREQPAFKGYRRNIFNPVFSDEAKIARQRAAAPKPVTPPPPVPKPAPVPVPPPVMPEPPRRELARFTFLGFLKKDGHRTIFLTKDGEIVLVRKGDRFAGRYQATSITDQALTITVTDTGEEIVIPLIENRQLLTAVK